MESLRSPKRRKLDRPARVDGVETTPRRTKVTPQTYSKKRIANLGEHGALGESHSGTDSAETGSVRNSAQKQDEANVYDDIEGAHAIPLRANLRSASGMLRRAPRTAAGIAWADRQVAGSPTQPRTRASKAKSGDSDDIDELAQSPSAKPSVTKRLRGLTNRGHPQIDDRTRGDEIRDLEEDGRRRASHEDTRGRSNDTPSAASEKARKPAAMKRSSKRSLSTSNTRKRQHNVIMEDVPAHEGGSDDDSRHDSMDVDKKMPEEETLRSGEVETASNVSAAGSASVRNITADVVALNAIQTILMERITGKRPFPLVGLDDEYAKISAVVEQTIRAGESNSMLLIGARGSGKTALMNQILCEQTTQHPDDFLVVRLNGFIHTDDKTALREIWRQLGRDADMEDDSTSKNYADTLTTLLALLSHPAEHGNEAVNQVTKSVVFVLDEFELFASHPRQTLLYNLFDIAQSRKAPIAVLGLTTRFDVAESLEKRVKSRFSHRFVYLPLSKSFSTFQDVSKAVLRIKPTEWHGGETPMSHTQNVEISELTKLFKKQCAAKNSLLDRWNILVDRLIVSEEFTTQLQHIYFSTKSAPAFLASILLPVAGLSVDTMTDSITFVAHFTLMSRSLDPPDSKLAILYSLSNLQMALLICAARLTNIHSLETLSFPLVYEEYKMLASKAKLQASASGAMAQGAGSRVWSKEVSRTAWEGVLEAGLVMEDGRGGGRVDVGLEEIGASGAELGSWSRWCREI